MVLPPKESTVLALAALEAMGVDNWDGYEYAFEYWKEDEYKEGLANYEEY